MVDSKVEKMGQVKHRQKMVCSEVEACIQQGIRVRDEAYFVEFGQGGEGQMLDVVIFTVSCGQPSVRKEKQGRVGSKEQDLKGEQKEVRNEGEGGEGKGEISATVRILEFSDLYCVI